MKKILILNGPNLNLLKERDSKIYGRSSLVEIENNCKKLADELKLTLEFKQSNSESELIELIQQAAQNKYAGIIINAAGYTHTSVAIRDALEIFKGAKIELHLSNIFAREEFRKNSFLSEVVDGIISGLGPIGYELALTAINKIT